MNASNVYRSDLGDQSAHLVCVGIPISISDLTARVDGLLQACATILHVQSNSKKNPHDKHGDFTYAGDPLNDRKF